MLAERRHVTDWTRAEPSTWVTAGSSSRYLSCTGAVTSMWRNAASQPSAVSNYVLASTARTAGVNGRNSSRCSMMVLRCCCIVGEQGRRGCSGSPAPAGRTPCAPGTRRPPAPRRRGRRRRPPAPGDPGAGSCSRRERSAAPARSPPGPGPRPSRASPSVPAGRVRSSGDDQRRPERSPVVACGRLDEEVVDQPAAQDRTVGRAVEGDAAGKAAAPRAGA